jgi:hypothetical protein
MTINATPRRLAASAVILASASVLVVAAHPMTATGSTSAETLTFNMRDGTFRFLDFPPKGERPSAGDTFVLTNRLMKGGDRIGTLHAVCTATRGAADPEKTPFLCQGVYHLKGGRITGDTNFTGENAVIKVAITGGTGDYAGASGEAVEVPTDRGSRVTVTLE